MSQLQKIVVYRTYGKNMHKNKYRFILKKNKKMLLIRGTEIIIRDFRMS